MDARYVWSGRLVDGGQNIEGSIEIRSCEPVVLEDQQEHMNQQVSHITGQRIVVLTLTLCH